MKKFSGVLLAGAFVLATAVPTFAADLDAPDVVDGELDSIQSGATGQEVESEGTLELPTISVTLPTSHGFILNPYNLEDAGQIISSVATISNASDVAVEVSLKSTTATIEGTDTKTKAVLGPVTDKTTTKTIQLDLNVVATAGTVATEKVTITGKNAVTKLVTLNAETGEATLSYDGKVVANPVGNPWSDADKISVSSIYTFTPVAGN